MPLILLKYSELTTVDGALVTGLSWTKVPLNKIVRDDNSNCVINANNTFTISNKVYPKIVRFNVHTSLVSTSGAATVAKSRLVKRVNGTDELIDTSLNYKLVTNQSQGLIKQITSYQLDKATTFRLDLWSTGNGVFGKAASDGSEERYANIEITIE